MWVVGRDQDFAGRKWAQAPGERQRRGEMGEKFGEGTDHRICESPGRRCREVRMVSD